VGFWDRELKGIDKRRSLEAVEDASSRAVTRGVLAAHLRKIVSGIRNSRVFTKDRTRQK